MPVFFLTVTLALAVSLSPTAGQDNAPSSLTLPVMSGVVTDVTPTDVTVRVGDNVVTFTIDKSTSVTARGALTNDLVYRGPYRPRTIRDFVKTGDNIRVRYRPIDDALLAVNLLVTTKRTTR
jgi:hypothetical protein